MKIAALFPTATHLRGAKQNARLNISKYFGLKVVINEIQKVWPGDIPVISFREAHLFDIILVSVHSVPDFYSLAYTFYNRMGSKRSGTWILGGAAICNIPPLLPFADYVVIGRAENIIVPLISSIHHNAVFHHASVVYTPEYSQLHNYQTAYVQKLYPDKIGNEKETMLGCKYNCSYCRYRVSSLPPNLRDQDRDTTMPGNEETFWELEIKNGAFYTTSLDGLTEKTRFAVVKHISNKAIIEKFRQLSTTRKILNLKIYLICGYPGQSGLDFSELKAVFSEVSTFLSDHRWNIKLHITPFSPEPQTPMQWEPCDVFTNYRELARSALNGGVHLIDTKQFSVVLLHTISGPWSMLKRVIFNRAYSSDAEIIRVISSTPYFRSHNNTDIQKFNKAFELFDLERFYQSYSIGAVLSSTNVKTWRNDASVIRQGIKTRKKLLEIAESASVIQ